METHEIVPVRTRTTGDTVKFFLFIAMIVVIGTLAILIGGKKLSQFSRSGPVDTTILPRKERPVASGSATIVYGTLRGEKAIIHAINTDGSNEAIIAELPKNIKDIHLLSPSKIAFISRTDDRDLGTAIELYDLKEQTASTIYTITKPWGINDLIVSPDAGWIAWQEIRLGPGKPVKGSRSRVYTANIATTSAQPKAQLVYDEEITDKVPFHRPAFFDHLNNIYAIGVLPAGGGWNHGLMKSSADGGDPEEILGLGEFVMTPKLAPGKDILAYTAYESGNTAYFGTEESTTAGYLSTRSINPNAIKLLDLSTGISRTVVSEPGRLYYDVIWDFRSSSLIASSFAMREKVPSDGKIITVPTDSGKIADYTNNPEVFGVLLAYTPDGLIIGKPTEELFISNLGETYAPGFSSIENYPGIVSTTVTKLSAVHLFGTGTGDLVMKEGGTMILGAEDAATGSAIIAGENAQYIGYLSRTNGQKLGISSALSVEKSDNPDRPEEPFSLHESLATRSALLNDPEKSVCMDDLSNLAQLGTETGASVQKALFQTASLQSMFMCYR